MPGRSKYEEAIPRDNPIPNASSANAKKNEVKRN